MLVVGDKCPQCKDGLLERTETGLECSKCDFSMDMADVIEANEREETHTEEYKFKSATLKVTIDTPAEAEEFLRGLVIAQQNTNSELFPLLIEGVNSLLVPWRAAVLRDQIAARGQ